MNQQWWLLGRDRIPVGPMDGSQLLQKIQSGRVASDALVCEVGAQEWAQIQSVPAFASALARLRIDGPTMVDPLPELPSSVSLDGDDPITVSNVPLRHFEDVVEATVVEKPLLPSDPPR